MRISDYFTQKIAPRKTRGEIGCSDKPVCMLDKIDCSENRKVKIVRAPRLSSVSCLCTRVSHKIETLYKNAEEDGPKDRPHWLPRLDLNQ